MGWIPFLCIQNSFPELMVIPWQWYYQLASKNSTVILEEKFLHDVFYQRPFSLIWIWQRILKNFKKLTVKYTQPKYKFIVWKVTLKRKDYQHLHLVQQNVVGMYGRISYDKFLSTWEYMREKSTFVTLGMWMCIHLHDCIKVKVQ